MNQMNLRKVRQRSPEGMYFCLLSLSLMLVIHVEAYDISRIRQAGRTAFAAKTVREAQSILPQCNAILLQFPNHPVWHYLTARVNAILDNREETFYHLEQAVLLGFGHHMLGYQLHAGNDPAFDPVRQTPAFMDIERRIQVLSTPVETGQIAFTVKDRSLQPEGIAYDGVTGSFFLGSESQGKIVRVNRDGEVSDFITAHQNGMGVLLGMEVHTPSRILWVCSVFNDGQPYRAPKTGQGWTGIFKYDLNTGKLIKQYTIPQIEERHEFNDLVVSIEGDVFITDSQHKAIHAIFHDEDQLQLWLKLDQFDSPNGITLSDDENVLYMADWTLGIYKVAIATREVTFLREAPGISAYGIDGLYAYKKSLVAVQNGLDRVAVFHLNENGDTILGMDILDANTTIMDVPTTGAVVGDFFYYIAKRCLTNYHKQQNLAFKTLREMTVVKVPLN